MMPSNLKPWTGARFFAQSAAKLIATFSDKMETRR
jgi:hypothetical protein